ncbi:MAG: Sec-independent protein translocase protein TatB [Pseudomonadota bacterium]|nr:Sec-independent protein translocase protein TatB [Pseudomonadota bacterium]
MFDLGWSELLIIGVVALIVIGPKDLPVMFQQVGRFVGRMRGMAREFSYAMNQAADEAGVKDATKGFKSATDGLKTMANPAKAATDAVRDKVKDATDFKLDLGTDSLSEERASAAKKIQEATAKKAAAAKEASETPTKAKPAATKKPAAKAAPKKATKPKAKPKAETKKDAE